MVQGSRGMVMGYLRDGGSREGMIAAHGYIPAVASVGPLYPRLYPPYIYTPIPLPAATQIAMHKRMVAMRPRIQSGCIRLLTRAIPCGIVGYGDGVAVGASRPLPRPPDMETPMHTCPFTHAPALWGDTVDSPADVAARLAPIAAGYDDPDALPAMVAYAMTRDLLDDYAGCMGDPDEASLDEARWVGVSPSDGVIAAFAADEADNGAWRGDADEAWRAVIWDAVIAAVG